MSKYTTPAPPVDMGTLVPELAPLARTTIRLHPHRVTRDLPRDSSKVGGAFLWPAYEPWPMSPNEDVPLVCVLQLRKDDFPEVEFYPGADLFQLLWTPRRDPETQLPRPQTFWRNIAGVTDVLEEVPDLYDYEIDLEDFDVEGNIPEMCSIHPETVIEYPNYDQLYWLAGEEGAKRIREAIGRTELPVPEGIERYPGETIEDLRQSYYCSNLAQCPGAKVTGKGAFEKDGKKWEHFITLNSSEYDRNSQYRWQALEDGPPKGIGSFRPTELEFGRSQKADIWICRESPDWPIRMVITEC